MVRLTIGTAEQAALRSLGPDRLFSYLAKLAGEGPCGRPVIDARSASRESNGTGHAKFPYLGTGDRDVPSRPKLIYSKAILPRSVPAIEH
jgi:hypothetical protein